MKLLGCFAEQTTRIILYTWNSLRFCCKWKVVVEMTTPMVQCEPQRKYHLCFDVKSLSFVFAFVSRIIIRIYFGRCQCWMNECCCVHVVSKFVTKRASSFTSVGFIFIAIMYARTSHIHIKRSLPHHIQHTHTNTPNATCNSLEYQNGFIPVNRRAFLCDHILHTSQNPISHPASARYLQLFTVCSFSFSHFECTLTGR